MLRSLLPLTLSALLACGGAQSPDDEPVPDGDAATHVYSGTVFPHQVANFRWQSDEVYDAEGMDVSSEYANRDGVRITAYVYPRPRVHTDPQEDLAAELQQALYAMESVHSDFQLHQQDSFQVLHGGVASDGFHVDAEGVRVASGEQAHVRTELYLFVHGPWFIKFRASYPADRAEAGAAAVRAFIDAFEWSDRQMDETDIAS